MKYLSGRLLLKKNLSSEELKIGHSELAGMIEVPDGKIRCQRCGSLHDKAGSRLPIGAYYCRTCIELGRVRSDEWLCNFPQADYPRQSYLVWQGELSLEQEDCSRQLKSLVLMPGKTWLHAVTGAGKTEMIYPAIDQVLQQGRTVALASPRVDVLIELHKRLSRDFSCEIPILYAESKDYFASPLVIASTHQLLRFREAFDLLIIDEVDAFPFVENPIFGEVLELARKADSHLLYMTATSHPSLELEVKQDDLYKIQLSRRFHGFPLVLPQLFWLSRFGKAYQRQRSSSFPLLIFVPDFKTGEDLAQKLGEVFVSSETPDRHELVEDFRSGKISVLISTTILERGVTFPKLDVFVYRADHFHFTAPVLVQIAGRVGRSRERPTGELCFFHKGKTLAMIRATAEIKGHNRGAFPKGGAKDEI
ncbi:competence protein ComFA [Lactococcus termiticola]|uniref:Competence protein ComFA n=1 Tax=Lactococcus termiticola TaxID=2169526 RepID=A0A2R5HJ03_9LACT|nr:DEAD/DEAH box helicase [Lactococcus termiticola]GBG96400.1 competence protein ComFA [Lactococcus termiticola]